MIDIIALIVLCRAIKKLVIAKGYKPAGYIFITIGLWLSCEIFFILIGLFIFGEGIFMYALGIFGAVIGGASSYFIAKSLKNRNSTEGVLDGNL